MSAMNTKLMPNVIDSIKNSDACRVAIRYYQNQDNDIREVLERGATDFDQPYSDEEPYYKAWAYVGTSMNMHYDANVAVFKAVFKRRRFLKDVPIIFIDFGCGPMTSGLALLTALDKTHADDSIAYVGVDVSKNMRKVAKTINDQHKLFARFHTGATFDKVIDDCRTVVKKSAMNAVINFSYVMAETTLKGDGAIEDILSGIWSLLNTEPNYTIHLVYQNPKDRPGKQGFTQNWQNLCNRLMRCDVSSAEIYESEINYGRPNPVHYGVACITKE